MEVRFELSKSQRGRRKGFPDPVGARTWGRCFQAPLEEEALVIVGASCTARQAAKKPLHWPLMSEPRVQTQNRAQVPRSPQTHPENRDHSWGRGRRQGTALRPVEEAGAQTWDPWLPRACLPRLLLSLWALGAREAVPGPAMPELPRGPGSISPGPTIYPPRP